MEATHMRLQDRPINTDSRTLEGVRNILTVTNKLKLATFGSCVPGTEIRCLRPNGSGYYMPCTAFIVAVTPSGRFIVDLWSDRSERVTVSTKAVLWPSTGKEGTSDEPHLEGKGKRRA